MRASRVCLQERFTRNKYGLSLRGLPGLHDDVIAEPFATAQVESCAELGWLLFEVPVQCSSVSNHWGARMQPRSLLENQLTVPLKYFTFIILLMHSYLNSSDTFVCRNYFVDL